MLLLSSASGLALAITPEPTPHELLDARLVIFPKPDWERLRAWRIAGYRFVAVVQAEEPPEGGRAALEPLYLVAALNEQVLVEAAQVGEALGKLVLPGLEIDLARAVGKGQTGELVRFSGLEVDLLAYLAARSSREISREELQMQVWGHKKALPTRAVDMAISRLRKKIEPDAAEPTVLLTRRGGGYRLVVEQEPQKEERSGLIGRGALLKELLERLPKKRLITLVGPPGVGKSRLAMECARLYSGPVWVVELASVTSLEELLLQVGIGTRLDVAGTGAGAVELARRLGVGLSGLGAGLLVLDNGEQLQSILARVLPEWLKAAPLLQILLSS